METKASLQPSYSQALRFWFKLGFISFGGPAGQIAIMHSFLVEQKKWISESRFMHALNYCMLLPGPEAQQLAIYTGWLLHGNKGGLAAGILFVLPSMFILMALSIVYVLFGNVPEIYALFNGLKPAVVAIILHALLKIGNKSLTTPLHYAIAVLAFCLIFFFNVSFPLIILGAIFIALITRLPWYQNYFTASHDKKIADQEEHFLDKRKFKVFKFTKFVKQLFFAILLWAAPFFYFFLYSGNEVFWKELIFFFTKAAFVTFGGAYAVLPYVAQESVEKLQWLNSYQMLDGLALGETTPGPLIMVLAFVGFMAGYNHFDSSIAMGSVALITTTFYTFLPCFLFIFAGAPIIEQTRELKHVKAILSLITAAVVGVILNLSVYLGKAVLFAGDVTLDTMDYFSFSWVIISLIALEKFKINIIYWILVSALAGLVKYLLL